MFKRVNPLYYTYLQKAFSLLGILVLTAQVLPGITQ